MYDLERPFHRLVHHFINRTFHGAGEGDELQFGIPALLGLLSTPAAFGAILLMNKYSTLLIFITGRKPFDVYRASVPDEYFFIVYSMVITGTIVILKWDRLFPDRQDYDNLAVLPISTRQIFAASLFAMLFLASVFAIDINAAACVIFPFAVTMRYDTFAAYSEFFVAHTSAVLLSSFFACFGLLSVLGFTMLVVPRRYLRTVSLFVRIACALLLVAVLGSAFSIPNLLLSDRPPDFVAYIPSVWFLDLHQGLLAHGTPLTGTGVFSIQITVAAFVLALVLYALTYYRHFIRIPERSSVSPTRGRDKTSVPVRVLDALVLRSPFQRATYHFVMRTLFRSERHCLLFGAAVGIGFFVAAQTLSEALANPRSAGLDRRLLSVSLILAYFIIVSLRALFDLPIERNANWVFRSTVDRYRHESRAVATKVMISMIVPWLVCIGLPLHIAAWGWTIGLLHTGYVLMCSIVLAELLLARFRKIPFTCMHTGSKDRVLVLILLSILGLFCFAFANASMEVAFLEQPGRLLVALPCLFALLLAIRANERKLPVADRTLIFEDRPAALLQLLNLTNPPSPSNPSSPSSL